MTDTIREEHVDAVAVLTMDRPAKRNALTTTMLLDLADRLARLGDDDGVTAVILTGAGGSFCAGADLVELASLPADRRRVLRARGRTIADRWPLLACVKPTIAAIDGHAVGMGVELALQCDVRYVTPGARLRWNFAELGIVPDMGVSTWLLPHVVGLTRAFELLYGCEAVDGAEAERLGLARLVADPQDLLPRALAAAASYAARPAAATAATKRLLLDGLTASPDDHLARHDAAMDELVGGAGFTEQLGSFAHSASEAAR